jgi:hypothetical protein
MILERANRILEDGVKLASQAGFDAEGRLERTSRRSVEAAS